jgi:sugar/nucleoside kinase (ribokinase family)
MLSKSQLEDLGEILRLGGPRTIALAVPEVPLELRRHLLELASRTGAFRAASFATAEVATAQKLGMFELLDLVSLNESEGEQLVGRPFSEESPEPFIEKCQDVLRGSYPQLKMVISAGKAGAYGITAQGHDFSPAHEVAVASTAGAGDSLLGGVLAALAAGIPFLRTSRGAGGPLNGSIETALQLGVLLGSYKCLSPHTIHPDASLDTLIEFAHNRGLEFSGKIESLLVQDEVTQHSN